MSGTIRGSFALSSTPRPTSLARPSATIEGSRWHWIPSHTSPAARSMRSCPQSPRWAPRSTRSCRALSLVNSWLERYYLYYLLNACIKTQTIPLCFSRRISLRMPSRPRRIKVSTTTRSSISRRKMRCTTNNQKCWRVLVYAIKLEVEKVETQTQIQYLGVEEDN
jgi:hypothetical protein